jgi:hypothetical protein
MCYISYFLSQNLLFSPSKPFSRGQNYIPHDIDLMIDCFVSCFRIKPHNNETLKVCLNPTSSFLYHYVLISSLYRYGILTVFIHILQLSDIVSVWSTLLCAFLCVVFIVMTYGHSLTYTVGVSGKVWRQLNFVQVIIGYMYCQIFMFIYRGVQMKPTLQHTQT